MDDPTPPNPYKTLNVPKDATLATIRSAHRKLVLSCHPDKVQDEAVKKVKAEQFHQVQQAYEILSDERQRQRYDERVKLDELRAEMASERGPSLSRRATDFEYPSPRSGPPPKREMRGGTIYETREPRNSRYSDEDYPTPRYDPRPSSKSYDDYYPRRSSGRAQEDKRRARDIEDERDRERDLRRKEREEMAFVREQRTKKRDKDKRRNTETKSKNKSAYFDSASDSELDDRRYTSRREPPIRPRVEEIPLRSREDLRKNSRTEQAYDDDELKYKIQSQQEHINRTRESVDIQPRRPGRNRAATNVDSRPPPPPPVDSTTRSSVRRGHSSRQVSPIRPSKKDKRSPEIVDPPSSRKPSLSAATSDPKHIKKGFWSSSPRQPQRSTTHQPAQDYKPPPIRRSETAPMHRADPLKSSTLRNMKASSESDSSDSDSDISEEITPHVRPNLRHTTTSYRVRDEEDSFVAEPQDMYPPKTRETSPKMRRATDRPTVGRSPTTRTPPTARPSAFAFQENDRAPRPGLARTESARPTPTKPHQSSRSDKHYFGEIRGEDHGRWSPDSYAEENSRYTKQYSRRGSEDVGRDDYPGSKFHRPAMGRSGTFAY